MNLHINRRSNMTSDKHTILTNFHSKAPAIFVLCILRYDQTTESLRSGINFHRNSRLLLYFLADDVAELCELLKCQCFATDGDRNAKFLNAFLDHFFGKMNVRRIIQAIGKRLSALIEGCTDDLKH